MTSPCAGCFHIVTSQSALFGVSVWLNSPRRFVSVRPTCVPLFRRYQGSFERQREDKEICFGRVQVEVYSHLTLRLWFGFGSESGE